MNAKAEFWRGYNPIENTFVYVVWKPSLVHAHGGQNWTKKLKKQWECAETLGMPHPVHLWSLGNGQPDNFSWIHIIICRNGKNHFLVVIINSHSKWIEVQYMTSTNAEKTVDELHLICATHRLPEEVVSNNGPQFESTAFAEFMQKYSFEHTLVPPYHP